MVSELVRVAPGKVAIGADGVIVPAIIAQAGDHAAKRFLEFFAATIRNRNTRRAYARAVCDFFDWCETHQIALIDIEPLHVAAYVELLTGSHAAPTAKQRLAAISMLFDWLVTGQIVPFNPAAAVRGPKHIVKRGKTPVLTAEEAPQLIDSIDVTTLIGLRDRALIGVMVFTFARVAAALDMKVGDHYIEGRKAWIRLHEKGGKRHEMPANHKAADYLDAYIAAAGIAPDKKKAPSSEPSADETSICHFASLIPATPWI